MIKLLILFLAGGAGTLGRYGTSNAVKAFWDTSFPAAVLIVNLVGCFLFGLLWAMFEGKYHFSSEFRLYILTGFLGGYTTFSAFIFDNYMLSTKSFWWMILNIGVQNVGGLLLFAAAVYIVKTVF
ncbi:CrcB family protein [Myxococcota bacterium]|nr:CrcB family protein [Myxococcota bacterium]MBU1379437.1 CrcB family protein [Myxococcota bacterium]MBU1497639.1 CrcB family protein [Myxococcota bacterium]